jgi:hypothetical protein
MNNRYERLMDQWDSFEDTPQFEKSLYNTSIEQLTPEVELYNGMDTSYRRTLNTIRFFVKSHLGRFKKSPDWKIEVWIKEKNDSDQSITCAVALRRTGGSTIYAKKAEGSISRAISTCLKVVEDSVSKERQKWRTSQR